MERENIELNEHIARSLIDENYEDYDQDEDIGFTHIDEKVTYVDMEKAYKTKEVIIQRDSDKKYFTFEYYDSAYVELFRDQKFPLKATEKFKKVIKREIFE